MKKLTKKEKAEWIKKLRPYAKAYEKAQDRYYEEIARIERWMNLGFRSKVWEYEIFVTDCGWLIGRMSKKTGRKQVLVHDMEFYDEE